MKIKAAVGILTFNSGKTIRRALESVNDFDEILICDGGSSDNTLDIAREFGAKVISQPQEFKNSNGTIADFSGVRNYCLSKASNDWFLYIDSDEAISQGLKEDVREITQTESGTLVYKVPMRIFIDSREIFHSSNYPGYQTRFFNKKSGAKFIKKVHERIDFENQNVCTLENPWNVFMTDYEAKNYYKENKKYLLMQANKKRTLFDYLNKNVFALLLNVFKILVKTFRNYIFYGYKKSMPWCVEWGRIKYQLGLMYYSFINNFFRNGKTSR